MWQLKKRRWKAMKTKRLKRGEQLPPDPEELNERRAQWAAVVLLEFQRHTGADVGDAVSDLLCDLMHWCDRHAQDFDAQLRRGRWHYDCETDA
jgi:hypothetical protein